MADVKKDFIYAVGMDGGASGQAISATTGNTYLIPMKREQGMGLVVINGGSSSVNVTVKAGTEYKKSLGDNVVAVAAGEVAVIPLFDSARYLIGNGENAGCCAITVSGAVSIVPFVI